MEHFFPPKSSGDLRSDALQSQIIGGDADEDLTQIIGWVTFKLLGDIFPHPSRVLTPLSITTKRGMLSGGYSAIKVTWTKSS